MSACPRDLEPPVIEVGAVPGHMRSHQNVWQCPQLAFSTKGPASEGPLFFTAVLARTLYERAADDPWPGEVFFWGLFWGSFF